MMKNSEWGAVAYLSQSKYGKYGNDDYEGANKEVYHNKSSSYITGSSNGTTSQETSIETQCTYDIIIDRGNGTGSCGGGASTTGNITGIYDMSGGAYEYVMGYLTAYGNKPWGSTSSTNYAKFTSKPDPKYFDAYTTTSATTACSGGACNGHALGETSGWYGDNANFVSTSYTWFLRGGGYNLRSDAGVFSFYINDGDSSNYNSFRVVFAPTT